MAYRSVSFLFMGDDDAKNCNEFSGNTAAQACYDYRKSFGKGDINQLDVDKNGIACEG